MEDNKPSFSTLSTKQKVIGVVTLLIVGFIIYEVIGLFSSGKSPETAMTPVPPNGSAQPKKMTTTTTTTTGAPAVATTPTMMQQMSAPNTLTTVSAITLPRDNMELQKQQQQQQQLYLDSVNQLQLLKIKREIAETNQAIAAARLATETANKNMSDLLTTPTIPQAPPGGNVTVPSGTITQGAIVGAQGTSQITTTTTTENAPPIVKAPVLDVPFTVVSVSMQFNHWNAVLGYQGKLYSVSIGDTLFEGSTVAAINKKGVTLIKDGKRRKISIQTTI